LVDFKALNDLINIGLEVQQKQLDLQFLFGNPQGSI